MRFIPTLTHGLLDYIIGGFLVATPWLMGFADGGAETWIPVVLGAATLAYSVLTDYEMGMVRRLPLRTHLVLDIGAGLLLAASPWLSGFAEQVWMPHLLLGLFEAGAALTTKTAPIYTTGTDRVQMSPRLRKGLSRKVPAEMRAQIFADRNVEETRQSIAQLRTETNLTSKEARRYEA